MVIHSYRVRYGYVPGDPALAAIEAKLAAQPTITVPAITLQGEAHGHGAAGGLGRRTLRISPGPTSAARSRASGTTFRRRRRAKPRQPCWNSRRR